MCYCASVTFWTRTLFSHSVWRENSHLTQKKKLLHFHLLPVLTMDRTLNNASLESLRLLTYSSRRIQQSNTGFRKASFSISVLDRHGESPTRLHLWAGRSHWAPQGKRQSQVLSRVRGRNGDYLLLEISDQGAASRFFFCAAVTRTYHWLVIPFYSFTPFLIRHPGTIQDFSSRCHVVIRENVKGIFEMETERAFARSQMDIGALVSTFWWRKSTKWE